MQVALNTRIEADLRVRLETQLDKEKLQDKKRSMAQIVAEAIEMYIKVKTAE